MVDPATWVLITQAASLLYRMKSDCSKADQGDRGSRQNLKDDSKKLLAIVDKIMTNLDAKEL